MYIQRYVCSESSKLTIDVKMVHGGVFLINDYSANDDTGKLKSTDRQAHYLLLVVCLK